MSTATLQPSHEAKVPHEDFLPLRGTDHVEFFVGNARQAAYFYRAAFGMKLVAYAGPETGRRDRASYVVQQGKVRFVLTTPLKPDSEIADHIAKHGDGVRSIALWVDDARKSWEETTQRGARSAEEPHVLEDEHGRAVVASIMAYGDTLHSFVERGDYNGPLPARLPRCTQRRRRPPRRPAAHRPLRGQRRLERHERVGQVLRRRHGLRPLSAL